MMRMNFTFAARAHKHAKIVLSSAWLKDHSGAVLVALCAYPMRWFGTAHAFFKSVHNSQSVPNTLKLVSLLLCFPCFHASDFFFKLAYFINHRRLIRIGRKCAALGGQNGALKLNHLSLDFGQRVELEKALRDVTSELEAGNRALNECHVHVDTPAVEVETPNV